MDTKSLHSRTLGLLSLGVLALLITLPNSGIGSSNSIKNEPQTSVLDIPAFGPNLPNNTILKQNPPAKVKSNATPIPIEFRTVGDQTIALTGQGVRIVGDLEMAINTPYNNIVSQRKTQQILPSNIGAISKIAQIVSLQIKNLDLTMMQKADDVIDTPKPDVPQVKQPELQISETLQAVTSLAQSDIIARANNIIAPIPMPLSMRPKNQTISTAQNVSKVEKSVSSIKITEIDNKQKLHKVDFYDLVAKREQERNVAIIEPTRPVTLPVRERLDIINQQNPTNQSEFLLTWQNSQ
ncbi:MAG: hypothetical protein L3J15_08515, partial [Devosiaceae bacterium]|nr:hypothetical protein [Devosiaceae bacterium]